MEYYHSSLYESNLRILDNLVIVDFFFCLKRMFPCPGKVKSCCCCSWEVSFIFSFLIYHPSHPHHSTTWPKKSTQIDADIDVDVDDVKVWIQFWKVIASNGPEVGSLWQLKVSSKSLTWLDWLGPWKKNGVKKKMARSLKSDPNHFLAWMGPNLFLMWIRKDLAWLVYVNSILGQDEVPQLGIWKVQWHNDVG